MNNSPPLVVSIHITHHAGTFLCHAAEYNNVSTPPKACITKGLTNLQFDYWRKRYGYFALEYRKPPLIPLQYGKWNDPSRIVSIVIMRHPMERLLAGDAMAEARYGKPSHRTSLQWWKYAHDDAYTNNYALRVFSGGDTTTEKGLEMAKSLLSKMTYIMDQECLNDNMAVLGEKLGWKMNKLFQRFQAKDRMRQKRQSARERIANDTLYDFLVKRNKNDIALYEWSKSKSLVVCSGGDESNNTTVSGKGRHTVVNTTLESLSRVEMIMPDRLGHVSTVSEIQSPQLLTLALALGLVFALSLRKWRGKRQKTAMKAT